MIVESRGLVLGALAVGLLTSLADDDGRNVLSMEKGGRTSPHRLDAPDVP